MPAEAQGSAAFSEPSDQSLVVRRGEVARINDGRNLTVRVNQGSVWLTHQGSTEDVVLETGDSLCLARDGLTLISVCGGVPFALVSVARVPVKPPPPGGLATRLLHWWANLHTGTIPRWHF